MQRIGPYQIAGELGRGAMGVVFRGLDPVIGRPVAIKIIQLQEFSDSRERAFLRQRLFAEARAAGNLSHPGIVTIYQVGEEGDLAYIAMEFVDGTTLESLFERDAAPRKAALLDALRQAAEALDYAHSQGVVHRDIKPANIMLRSDGVAKITDFGVAKFFAAKKSTQSGLILGTPHYMSPEQIQGEPMDGRADQFSLAVIAYEMVAGVQPFTAETLTTLFYRILHKEPAPLLEHNPELSPEVDAVLNRALAKTASDRYGSCAEFVSALRTACEAIPAWNAGLVSRARNKRLLTVAAPAYEPEVITEAPVSEAAPIDLVRPHAAEVPPPLPAPARLPAAPRPGGQALVYILGAVVVVLAGLLVYATMSRREARGPQRSVELQLPAEPVPAPRRGGLPATVREPARVAPSPSPTPALPAPTQSRRESAPPPVTVQNPPPLPAPQVERPAPQVETPAKAEAPPPTPAPKVERPAPQGETPPKVEPPPAPAPAEPVKTKPAPAGPQTGRVFWTGQLAKGQTASIDTQTPSLSLLGRFPRAAVRILRVWPGELSATGAKLYAPDASLHGVNEAPTGRNGGKATRYVFDPNYAGAITVVQVPTPQNQWRLVLRSESRRLSAIAIDWEVVP